MPQQIFQCQDVLSWEVTQIRRSDEEKDLV